MSIGTETIAGWARELSGVRDEIERKRAELREQLAAHRKNVESLKKREEHLFGLISGREHEQLPLGMGAGAPAAGESAVPGARKKAEKKRPAPKGQCAFHRGPGGGPGTTEDDRKCRLPKGHPGAHSCAVDEG
jgi:hypothetical protein